MVGHGSPGSLKSLKVSEFEKQVIEETNRNKEKNGKKEHGMKAGNGKNGRRREKRRFDVVTHMVWQRNLADFHLVFVCLTQISLRNPYNVQKCINSKCVCCVLLCADGKLKTWVYGVAAGAFVLLVFIISMTYLAW